VSAAEAAEAAKKKGISPAYSRFHQRKWRNVMGIEEGIIGILNYPELMT
jgi:hypothetical protein